jgi:cell division protein FtsI (penicillin-binding protein 3)
MISFKKISWRLLFVFFCLLLSLAVIVWQLLQLNVFNRPFLMNQGNARALRIESIHAHRGMIIDRSGSPLAISTPVSSIYVNPKIYHATKTQQAELAKLLNWKLESLQKKLKLYKGRSFVYLKRQMPPDSADKIKKLDIPGVFIASEYKRYYPEGSVASHVVGMTNIDDIGQEGLELAYNDWLSGKDGKREVLKDRLGHVVSTVALLKQPVQGRDLQLTIDHRLQFIAHEALQKSISAHNAESGSIVVLDAKTGEILVDVNYPTYNPNNRSIAHTNAFRNRALTDMFEPGSTMKPFTIALALSSGKYTSKSTVDTNPGRMKIGGYEIKDDGLNYGVINLQQVIEKSSNIGAAKILLSLSPQNFWNLLKSFGFGQKTQSGYPGEVSGRLISHPVWYPSDVATLAYGYGISVTTMQLAHAYQVLANDGNSVPVTFIKNQHVADSTSIIAPDVAKEVVSMLETVVTGGTGTRAKVLGYRVAGKTGTAYIASRGGYDKSKFMSSFVGLAPVSNPRFVIAVAIRDPKGQHFGSLVAAPVFSTVMSNALRLWDVKPDA